MAEVALNQNTRTRRRRVGLAVLACAGVAAAVAGAVTYKRSKDQVAQEPGAQDSKSLRIEEAQLAPETAEFDVEELRELKSAPACPARTTTYHDPSALVPSPKDTARRHRLVELSNGIVALLTTDSTENAEAAASLNVNVGSADDPAQVQGLAHFLEHMMFLGSTRYPTPNEVSAYLQAHGGRINAYTDELNTNYQLSVANEALPGALDRFAAMFEWPLLADDDGAGGGDGADNRARFAAVAKTMVVGDSPANSTRWDVMQRELHVVDAEHRKNLLNDAWRSWQLLHHVAAPGSELNHFGTGNLETLNVPDIQRALRDFWRRHYTAPNMRLAVVGSAPLDELEQTVRATFAAIPNHPPERAAMTPMHYEDVLPDASVTCLKPAASAERRSISLAWAIPAIAPRFDYTTMSVAAAASPFDSPSYVSMVLGDEGVGSILAHLKRRGLATALASSTMRWRDFALVSADIELTAAGDAAWREVASVVEAYVTRARKSSRSAHCAVASDAVHAAELKFLHGEVATDAVAHVTGVTAAMGAGVPPAELLGWGGSEFDGDGVSAVLDAMRAPLVMRTSAACDGGELLEPHYDMRYALDALEPAYTVMSTEHADILHLPPVPNVYLPDRVASRVSEAQELDVPELAVDRNATVVWLQPRSGAAEAELRCSIRGPSMWDAEDPLSSTKTAAALALMTEAIAPEMYAAQRAGSSMHVDVDADGALLAIGGWSSSLHAVLRAVLDELGDGDEDVHDGVPPLVTRVLESMQQEVALEQTAPLYRLTASYFTPLATTPERVLRWADRRDALATLAALEPSSALREIVMHMRDALARARATCVLVGDADVDDAARVASALADAGIGGLAVAEEGEDADKPPRALATGKRTFAPPSKDDANVVVDVAVPLGAADDATRALGEVIEAVASPEAFDQLRTRSELGAYVVWAWVSEIHDRGALALRLLVQSGTRTVQDVEAAMAHFLNTGLPSALQAADAPTVRAGAAAKLLAPPTSLAALANRLLSDAVHHGGDWSWRKRVASLLVGAGSSEAPRLSAAADALSAGALHRNLTVAVGFGEA